MTPPVAATVVSVSVDLDPSRLFAPGTFIPVPRNSTVPYPASTLVFCCNKALTITFKSNPTAQSHKATVPVISRIDKLPLGAPPPCPACHGDVVSPCYCQMSLLTPIAGSQVDPVTIPHEVQSVKPSVALSVAPSMKWSVGF